MTEEEMLQLLKKQDFDGLQTLIDLYGTSIHNVICAILSTPNERNHLDDVMNEVLYTIWSKIADFDSSKSSLLTWIMMITRSKSIDFKRKINKQQQINIEDVPHLTGKESTALERESFLSLIEMLSDRDQLIFLYYYFYQFPTETIGEKMKMSVEQIHNHLSRGRKKLSTILDKEDLHYDKF